MASETVELIFRGDSTGATRASREVARSLGKEVPDANVKAQRSFAGLGRAAKIASGILLGALAVGAKRAFDELSEAERVSAQTEAALRSTGGGANVTAKQIENLAGKLSELSGVDDEAIQAGENLLLTFRHVRNEAGKGNDVFDQATRAALDMSVAMGQDLNSSMLQLGKALDSPLRGMTALTRAGVTFSEKQREQIKALVESGKTLEAQKLILAELEKQFGGSAKAAGDTMPGQLAKLRNSFDETAGELLKSLLPALTSFLRFVQRIVHWLGEHKTAAKVLIGTLGALAVAVWAVNIAMLANPAGAVVLGIAALGAAIVLLITHFQEVKAWLGEHWDEIVTIILGPFGAIVALAAGEDPFGMFSALKGVGTRALDGIKDGIADLASIVEGKVLDGVAKVTALFERAFGAAKDFGGKLVSGLVAGITDFATKVFDKVTAAIGKITGKLDDAFSAAKDFGGKILSGLVEGAGSIVTWIGEKIGAIPGKIRDFLTEAKNAAAELGGKILSGIGDGLSTLGQKLVSWIKAPINAVIRGLNALAIPGFDTPDIPAVKVLGKTVFPGVGVPDFPGFDPFNIPELAAGVRNFAGGLAVVGERGAELVRLPRGSDVIPAGHAGLGGIAPVVNLNFKGANFYGSSQREAEHWIGQVARREAPRIIGFNR